jgi:hypothetical protein
MVGAFHWVSGNHRRAVQLEPAVGTEAVGTKAVEMGSWNGQYGECSGKGRGPHQLLEHIVGSVVNIAGA